MLRECASSTLDLQARGTRSPMGLCDEVAELERDDGSDGFWCPHLPSSLTSAAH